MLSVIIPTDGLEQPAVATLAALVPGTAAGIVREVLLVDRSGTGVIERVADVAGCRFLAYLGGMGSVTAMLAGNPEAAFADMRQLPEAVAAVAASEPAIEGHT